MGLALMGGCATHRSVTLLPGEPGHPVGAVAVLNEDGSERGLLDAANERAALGNGSGRVHGHVVAEDDVQQKYGALIANLPPPPNPYVFHFDLGRSKLAPDQEAKLQVMLGDAKSRSGAEVQVVGHTDTVGSDKDNDELSMHRAIEVREYLISRGLPPAQVRATWRGERELAVQTPDNTPNPENRRVVLIVR